MKIYSYNNAAITELFNRLWSINLLVLQSRWLDARMQYLQGVSTKPLNVDEDMIVLRSVIKYGIPYI